MDARSRTIALAGLEKVAFSLEGKLGRPSQEQGDTHISSSSSAFPASMIPGSRGCRPRGPTLALLESPQGTREYQREVKARMHLTRFMSECRSSKVGRSIAKPSTSTSETGRSSARCWNACSRSRTCGRSRNCPGRSGRGSAGAPPSLDCPVHSKRPSLRGSAGVKLGRNGQEMRKERNP